MLYLEFIMITLWQKKIKSQRATIVFWKLIRQMNTYMKLYLNTTNKYIKFLFYFIFIMYFVVPIYSYKLFEKKNSRDLLTPQSKKKILFSTIG